MDDNPWLIGFSIATLCLIVLLIIGGNQGFFDPLLEKLTRHRKPSSDEDHIEFSKSGDTARVIKEKPHRHFWEFNSSETYRHMLPFKSWYGQIVYNFSCCCGETHTISKKDFWISHGSS